jgi:hypothetical protein
MRKAKRKTEHELFEARFEDPQAETDMELSRVILDI